MRLQRVRIAAFKNLQDFQIDLGKVPLTVLVGRNGTGKSNFLEALTIIFRDLDLRTDPAFKYEIDYVCRGIDVHVDADPERAKERTKLLANGKPVRPRNYDSYWPSNVFGYYSGPSNRMEGHFETHRLRLYRALLAGQDPPSRLFFARPEHSQFVLLAFFTEQDKVAENFLKSELRIQNFESALFVIHRPGWARTASGDQRFWGARGTVQVFLDKLYRISLAPMRLKIPGQRNAEFIYMYLPHIATLRRLREEYDSQRALFDALVSTSASDLIEELRIRVRVADS